MKILYVGPFRDWTGWGYNAINAVLALDAAGVDVVPRCVKFSRNKGVLPERLLELEAKSDKGCDVVVQNSLPQTFQYDGRYAANIGYYFVECDGFGSSNWARHINAMDRAWVPCGHNAMASHDSGVAVPIDVIPCAADTDAYARHHEPLSIRDRLKDRFVFYFVGEDIPRKGIGDVVKAFHCEFHPDEPVELLLKISRKGQSPGEAQASFRKSLDQYKMALNLYGDIRQYKQEIVVTEHLGEADMLRLHATGDCFVSASHGEGWGMPAFDAMAMGRTPILSYCTAHKEYAGCDVALMVDGRKDPVFGMQEVHGDLYTARESWFTVDHYALRHAMRAMYAMPEKDRAAMAMRGRERAGHYSRVRVGNLMKGRLEDALLNVRA